MARMVWRLEWAVIREERRRVPREHALAWDHGAVCNIRKFISMSRISE